MTKTIASRYYEARSAERPLYHGRFALPGVKRGDPAVLLVVPDHYQIEDEPQLKANAAKRQRRETIAGEEIAADLVDHWTLKHRDSNPQCHPAIWIIRDSVPLFDEENRPINDAEGRQVTRPATADEKAAMFAEDEKANMAAQDQWVQAAIDKGNQMAEDPKKIPWIPEYCRIAAQFAGQTPLWLKRHSDTDNVKECGWCTKPIPSRAITCPNCHAVVDPVRHAQKTKADQQAVSSSSKGVVQPPVDKQNQPAA